jgi:hypothetical protein
MILYVLGLKGEEEIVEIIEVTDEKGIVKYAKNIVENQISNTYGTLANALSNMMYYLSQTGTFYFKDKFCVVDMEFIALNELKISNYFLRNYVIYKNLMGLLRDKKLKKLGI